MTIDRCRPVRFISQIVGSEDRSHLLPCVVSIRLRCCHFILVRHSIEHAHQDEEQGPIEERNSFLLVYGRGQGRSRFSGYVRHTLYALEDYNMDAWRVLCREHNVCAFLSLFLMYKEVYVYTCHGIFVCHTCIPQVYFTSKKYTSLVVLIYYPCYSRYTEGLNFQKFIPPDVILYSTWTF